MGAREEGLRHEELTGAIAGAFFEVYNELGFGLFESAYAAALEIVLRGRGHRVRREVAVTIVFRGVPIARQKLDMVVDECVVVEIKSTMILPPSSRRQLLSYLKSTRLEVGLLLHFGPEPRFHRIISSNAPGSNRP